MKRFKVVIYFWNIWVQRWLFILSHSNISGPHHKESLHSREVKVGVRQWEDSRKQRWFTNLKWVGYSWLKISDVADVPTELTTAPSNQISDFFYLFIWATVQVRLDRAWLLATLVANNEQAVFQPSNLVPRVQPYTWKANKASSIWLGRHIVFISATWHRGPQLEHPVRTKRWHHGAPLIISSNINFYDSMDICRISPT